MSKGRRLMLANNLAVATYALDAKPEDTNGLMAKMYEANQDLSSYILWLERRVPAAYKEYTT